jgi:ElaB/YqjD/DUF883 family membrane-anchored ribosome-binding protein
MSRKLERARGREPRRGRSGPRAGLQRRRRSRTFHAAGAVALAALLALLAAATPPPAGAQRLVFDPPRPSLEKDVEATLTLRVEDDGGAPREAADPVRVTLSGAGALTDVTEVVIPAGASSVELRVVSRAWGLWTVEASAPGLAAATALVSCAQPLQRPAAAARSLDRRRSTMTASRSARLPAAVVRPEGGAAGASRDDAADAAGAAAAPPRPDAARDALELAYPRDWSDLQVGELLRATVARAPTERFERATPEERSFVERLQELIRTQGGLDAVKIRPEGELLDQARWVSHRVVLETGEEVVVEQAAQSEETEGLVLEEGDLVVVALPTSRWPVAGVYDPVEVEVFWVRNGVPAHRARPLDLRLVAESPSGAVVTPARLTIDAGRARADVARLTAERPGAVALRAGWFTFQTDPPVQVAFQPPPPRALRFTGLPERVRGFVRNELEVVVELVSDTGTGTDTVADRVVLVQLTGGDSTSRAEEVEVPAGSSTARARFVLDEHGDYRLRASSTGLDESTAELVYAAPWLAVGVALLGGLLGAGVRLSQRTPKQRKRLALRVVVGGVAGALLLLLFQVFAILERLEGLAPVFGAFTDVSALNLFGALLLGLVGGLGFEHLLGPFVGKEKG